jgi:hypothetical protein
MRHSLTIGGAILALLLTTAPAAVQAQTNGEKLHIETWAVNMSNIATGANQVMMIDINSWSTEAERAALVSTMLDKGQNALLRALQQTPSKGRMWYPQLRGPDPTNARLGYQLHYAWQAPLPDGGRRIVVATDRYITFWEARDQPRVSDYPFTLIEIHVDKDGVGEGKMSIATKIKFDKTKNTIVLENYSSEPVRLQKVKVTAKT